MRIIIATVQVPFIHGGAELHAAGLHRTLNSLGHVAEIIAAPFRFSPNSEVRRSIEYWRSENLKHLNGYLPDKVICLKFPAYYLSYPNKVTWLLHQHRSVYDQWSNDNANPDDYILREEIKKWDSTLLDTHAIYTNSNRVSQRLKEYNNLDSSPLYHPPPLIGEYFCGPHEPYIFFPSRLENLKRQDLLIEAMRYVRAPVYALIAGNGGQKERYAQLIENYGLNNRVKLLGQISTEELIVYFAHSLAVFFGPKDEDYGYVTLEAMLSAKPVITCTDSGGPLEFVKHSDTGFVVAPRPESIASAIDFLFFNQQVSKDMGQAGLAHYHRLNISWEAVVNTLLR